MEVYGRTKQDHAIVEVFARIGMRVPFRGLNVFEPFCGDGSSQTRHYAGQPTIIGLEGWDIDPALVKVFKNRIPRAEVRVCDTYKEVGSAALQPDFDVIVIDNNLVGIPHEHFELFPAILKALKPHGFLVVSVCQDPGGYYVPREAQIRAVLGTMTEPWVRDWDRGRGLFYKMFPMVQPEDYDKIMGRIMPLSAIMVDDMVPIYMEKALKAGFFTKYHSTIERSKWMSYILLELSRARPEKQRFDEIMDKKAKDDAKKTIDKPAKSGN